jgi:hypothetical protein
MGDFINKLQEEPVPENGDFLVFDIIDVSLGQFSSKKISYQNFSKILSGDLFLNTQSNIDKLSSSVSDFQSKLLYKLDKRGLSYNLNERMTGSLNVNSVLSCFEIAHFNKDLNSNVNKIINLSAQSFNDYDGVNKQYVDNLFYNVPVVNMSLFVLKSGDRMTGYLNLTSSVFNTNDAINKKYVDDIFIKNTYYLPISGGLMSGYLNVLNPLRSNHTASKEYVDSLKISSSDYLQVSGGSLSSYLTVLYPTISSHVSNKLYVDDFSDKYVKLNGSRVTPNFVTLNYSLTNASSNWAITKQYVDDIFEGTNLYVPISGNKLMTGNLIPYVRTPVEVRGILSPVIHFQVLSNGDIYILEKDKSILTKYTKSTDKITLLYDYSGTIDTFRIVEEDNALYYAKQLVGGLVGIFQIRKTNLNNPILDDNQEFFTSYNSGTTQGTFEVDRTNIYISFFTNNISSGRQAYGIIKLIDKTSTILQYIQWNNAPFGTNKTYDIYGISIPEDLNSQFYYIETKDFNTTAANSQIFRVNKSDHSINSRLYVNNFDPTIDYFRCNRMIINYNNDIFRFNPSDNKFYKNGTVYWSTGYKGFYTIKNNIIYASTDNDGIYIIHTDSTSLSSTKIIPYTNIPINIPSKDSLDKEVVNKNYVDIMISTENVKLSGDTASNTQLKRFTEKLTTINHTTNSNITLNSNLGNSFFINLNGNCTGFDVINLSPNNVYYLTLSIVQKKTVSPFATVNWSVNGSTILWEKANTIIPSITQTADKLDVFTLIHKKGTWYGINAGQNR